MMTAQSDSGIHSEEKHTAHFAMQIHVARNGKTLGIFSSEELQTKANAGEVFPDDDGWIEGMTEWRRLAEICELSPIPNSFSPAAQQASNTVHPAPVAPQTTFVVQLLATIENLAKKLGISNDFIYPFIVLAIILGITIIYIFIPHASRSSSSYSVTSHVSTYENKYNSDLDLIEAGFTQAAIDNSRITARATNTPWPEYKRLLLESQRRNVYYLTH